MTIRIILAIIAFATTAPLAIAQRGYTELKRKDALVVGTRWAKAKDENGVKRTALLISVVNNDRQPTAYSFNINFYYEGRLRETATVETTCIDGLKSRVGKLSGIYLIPKNFTDEQLKAPDFSFEIDAFETEAVERCTQE